MTKQELRQMQKELLSDLADDRLKNININFNESLLNYFEQKSGLWGAFAPIQKEPQILDSLEKLSHIEWCFPKIVGNNIEFFHSQPNSLEIGQFGIKEPREDNSSRVSSGDIEGLLIPGLSFNLKGMRLGRGQGYYDRFLESFAGVKVGVCYQCQVFEGEFPVEEHDALMDQLLTDQGLHLVTQAQQIPRNIERTT